MPFLFKGEAGEPSVKKPRRSNSLISFMKEKNKLEQKVNQRNYKLGNRRCNSKVTSFNCEKRKEDKDCNMNSRRKQCYSKFSKNVSKSEFN